MMTAGVSAQGALKAKNEDMEDDIEWLNYFYFYTYTIHKTFHGTTEMLPDMGPDKGVNSGNYLLTPSKELLDLVLDQFKVKQTRKWKFPDMEVIEGS